MILINVRLADKEWERLKRAAYWVPGATMSEIVRRGVQVELDRLEEKNGGPFEKIPECK